MKTNTLTTKDKIIKAFLKLITIKDFEHITIKDIAHYAEIHRITFYDYYTDKYELLDDIYQQMKQEATIESTKINKKNNINESSYLGVSNYLHCFVNALKKRNELVIALANQTGGYIYFAFVTFLNDSFCKLITYHNKEKKLIYSLEQTSSFMIGGIISFVISSYKQGKYKDENYDKLFYDAQNLIQKLFLSNIIFVD